MWPWGDAHRRGPQSNVGTLSAETDVSWLYGDPVGVQVTTVHRRNSAGEQVRSLGRAKVRRMHAADLKKGAIECPSPRPRVERARQAK